MKKLLMVVIVAVVLAAGVSFANAAIPSADGTIHGCYHNNTGALRVIDGDTESCPSGFTPLNWSQGVELPDRMIHDVRRAGGTFDCSSHGSKRVFLPEPYTDYVVISASATSSVGEEQLGDLQWVGLTHTDPGLESEIVIRVPPGGLTGVCFWHAVIAQVTP